MADAGALHDSLLTCLREITAANGGVTVFDGDVPDQPPAEAKTKRVLPYLVLWASSGAPPAERAVTDRATVGLDWPVQVTVAAGTQSWVLGAVSLVRQAVAALVLPGGGLLLEDTTSAAFVALDRDVSPPRYFVPLRFRSLTA